jgi:DNA-binding NtrC family response regulator
VQSPRWVLEVIPRTEVTSSLLSWQVLGIGAMSPRVLIVVRETLSLETVANRLRQRDMSVFTVGSEQQVIQFLSRQDVDVVLLDMRYPEEGEFALQSLGHVKGLRPCAEVIVLSRSENIALSMEGMRQGASDDITVPFDFETLVARIEEARARKDAREARAHGRR